MSNPSTIDEILHFYLPRRIAEQMASQELPPEEYGRRLWFEEQASGADPHYGIYLSVLAELPIGIGWRVTYYPEPGNAIRSTMLLSDTLLTPPGRGLGVYTIRGHNDEACQAYQFTIIVAEAND